MYKTVDKQVYPAYRRSFGWPSAKVDYGLGRQYGVNKVSSLRLIWPWVILYRKACLSKLTTYTHSNPQMWITVDKIRQDISLSSFLGSINQANHSKPDDSYQQKLWIPGGADQQVLIKDGVVLLFVLSYQPTDY